MKLCDINEAYPIGNGYYLTITLTAAADVCRNYPEDLRKDLDTLYQGMLFRKV